MPEVQHPRPLIRFGTFELDSSTGELLGPESTIRLQPQPLRVLLVLLNHPGELITREQLKREILPDALYGDPDHALNLAVTKIRTALHDSADTPEFIETLPRRGYRFIVHVEHPSVSAVPSCVGQPESRLEPQPRLAADQPEPPLEAGTPGPASPDPAQKYKGLGFVIAIGAIVVALVLALLLYVPPRRKKLTDKDTVVIATFTNTTGDPVFDNTLRQGLLAQLQQSPFLKLLSDRRIAQVLSLMMQPKGTPLTNELAREVCQRTASAATIEGSIDSLGKQYVLHLETVNCQTGDLLANVQVTAEGKEQVLQSLGVAATKLREQMGELLPSIEKHTAPADDVTTPSLEALQAYSLAVDAVNIRDDESMAATLFQRAIELDPNFAMAYARQGTAYANLGQSERGAESFRKAYALRDHVSGREKLYIESHYQQSVLGNLEEARKVYATWLEIYPRDSIPITNLSVINFNLGQYRKNDIPVIEEMMRLEPQSGFVRVELVWVLTYLGRLDEAKVRAQEASADHVDTPDMHLRLYKIAFLEHDTEAMKREVAYLSGVPDFRDQILSFEADTAAYAGQFAHARGFTRRAADTAILADRPESAAAYYAAAAVAEAFAGNDRDASEEAHAALMLANSWYVQAQAGIALALAGDLPTAQRVAEDLNQRFPQGTIIQFNLLPCIRSAIGLRQGEYSKAIETLVPAENYDFATSLELVNQYPAYLRGLAYLANNQGKAAAAEFQKLHDHRTVVANTPIGSLAHLGTARAFLLVGDMPKAKHSYEEFLKLWKDADSGTPILRQASVEYAKLK